MEPSIPAKPPTTTPEVLYRGPARHTAAMGRYVAWSLAAVATVAAAVFVHGKAPTLGWWPALATVLPLGGLLWTYLVVRTTRYTVSPRRIEVERGVLSRRVTSLELWRVLDVGYRQTVLDRIFRDGRIELASTDRSDPALVLHGLPDSRRIFEALRDAVADARLRAGSRPLEVVGADGTAGVEALTEGP